jgi:hypothetical protein
MFDGIDAVPWASLRHANGSAADVPELLRALASPSEDVRAEIRRGFPLIRPHTVYEATAPAIPFLVEIVATASVALLAREETFALLRTALDVTSDDRDDCSGATRASIERSLPRLLDLLRDEAPSIRCWSAHVVSHLHATKDTVVDALRPALASESNPLVRASLHLASARLGVVLEAAAGDAIHADDPVRLAACFALVRAQEKIARAVIDHLLEIEAAFPPPDAHRFRTYCPDGLFPDVVPEDGRWDVRPVVKEARALWWDVDEDLFEGIDDVAWSSLHHAYGSAADVPELLRTLASPDDVLRRELWEGFGLVHQGSVYEATAPAVPFLTRIATRASVSLAAREDVLDLLATLAMAKAAATEGSEPHQMRINPFTRKPMPFVRDATDWVTPTRGRLIDSVPSLLTLLTDPEPSIREKGKVLLSLLPEATVT